MQCKQFIHKKDATKALESWRRYEADIDGKLLLDVKDKENFSIFSSKKNNTPPTIILEELKILSFDILKRHFSGLVRQICFILSLTSTTEY